MFLVLFRIDGLIEGILKIFDLKALSEKNRLLYHVFYQLFVDLLKIYQSYYLLVTVLLEKFSNISIIECKRTIIIYMNFIKINVEVRKIATSLIKKFKIKIDFHFYDVEPKVVDEMIQ
jgi:hypothetical protein